MTRPSWVVLHGWLKASLSYAMKTVVHEDPDAGKDCMQMKKRVAEDEMVR